MLPILFTSPLVNRKIKFDSSLKKETDNPNETLDRSHLLLSNGERVDIHSRAKKVKSKQIFEVAQTQKKTFVLTVCEIELLKRVNYKYCEKKCIMN